MVALRVVKRLQRANPRPPSGSTAMLRPDLRFVLAAMMMPFAAQSAGDDDEAGGGKAEEVDEEYDSSILVQWSLLG